jgi:hypothetical protein
MFFPKAKIKKKKNKKHQKGRGEKERATINAAHRNLA